MVFIFNLKILREASLFCNTETITDIHQPSKQGIVPVLFPFTWDILPRTIGLFSLENCVYVCAHSDLLFRPDVLDIRVIGDLAENVT